MRGRLRFFIIRDADKMHINAANSLLNFIEEPQSQIYIFLLTADDSRMLPTIKKPSSTLLFSKESGISGRIAAEGRLVADTSQKCWRTLLKMMFRL